MASAIRVPDRLLVGDFVDVTQPVSGDDGYAFVWDEGTGKAIWVAMSGGGGTPGGSATHVQVNDGAGGFGGDSGFVYAGSGVATLTGRLSTPSVRAVTDSTAAIRFQTATGTDIFSLDTTNLRVGIGTLIPQKKLHIYGDNGTDYLFQVESPNQSAGFLLMADKSTGYAFFSLRHISAGGDGWNVQMNPNRSFSIISRESSVNTNRILITPSGQIGLTSISSPTAFLHLPASTASYASLCIPSGTWPTTPNDGDIANNGSSIVAMINGTNAVNTDGGLAIWMQSSTTARNVGRLLWQYTDKTDATRVTEGSVTAYYQSTEHKAIRWRGGSGGTLLSFYDVTTPIARQVLATGAGMTVDDVIQVLQNLGLVKQS